MNQFHQIKNLPKRKQDILENIITKVCEYYDLDVEEIQGKSQIQTVVIPRHIAIHLCLEKKYAALSELGKLFHKDSCTLMRSRRVVNGFLDVDTKFKEEFNAVKNTING